MKSLSRLMILGIGTAAILTVTARTANSQCCVLPTQEVVGAPPIADPGTLTQSKFYNVISNSAGTDFSGRHVREGGTGNLYDQCYFTGSAVDPAELSGGTWLVGGGNHWAYDTVGWDFTAVDYYRQNGPAHGIGFPCEAQVFQDMSIECTANQGDYAVYLTQNILQSIIFDDGHVTNCRIFTCHTINY